MQLTANAFANSSVQTQTISRRPGASLACFMFSLALLFTCMVAHSAHAAAAVGARWAYIADPAGFVHVYTANRATGALAVDAPCLVQPAGLMPMRLKIDPSRSFVYVVDNKGGAIFGFTINQANGCIAPTAQIQIPTAGANPMSPHITADGKYLYVSDTFGGAACVEGFSITPLTGVLVPLGPPVPYGIGASDLAYDPVEDLLLAADDSAPVGPITTYTVGAGGALGIPDAVTPTVVANPFAMNADDVNGFLLVLSGAGPNLDSYTINLATGALVHNNAQATGVGPHSVVSNSNGQTAYVTNNTASTISSYSILPGGALLKWAGADTALRAPALNPTFEEIEASGTFLYTLDGSGHVSIFRITAGKAAEAAAAVSPFVLPFVNPSGIAITH